MTFGAGSEVVVFGEVLSCEDGGVAWLDSLGDAAEEGDSEAVLVVKISSVPPAIVANGVSENDGECPVLSLGRSVVGEIATSAKRS